ncbi:MAG TPA: arylamine N-acetyltransferase [Caulobacteraceae bacterium]|jgi:N-hydroxyarylamine O-acetyltransferase
MSEPPSFDLDAYCARIGYDGPREPTLAVLSAIHALQPAVIPFENLDPLLGRPVPLDLASLQAKLIASRRGGYCFELNALFRAALEALGLAITPLIARVRWMAPSDRPEGPRSHMLLRVDLEEGTYLADVAFGGHLVAAPLRLIADIEQQAPGGLLRLVADGSSFTQQTLLPSGWQDVYRFTLEPAQLADYEVSNWFTSTHPASIFRNALLAERLTPKGRYSLMNQKLTVRSGGEAIERTLADEAELGEVLETVFGVTPPSPTREVWARLPPV